MFEGILSYLKFGNRFCGVEHLDSDGQDRILVTVLKKTKGELQLGASHDLVSTDELKEKIPKGQPVYLVLTGDRILTKKMETVGLDPLALVNRAFPNISISDFYYEIWGQEGHRFISICRKEYVDGLTESYKRKGITLLSVSLGHAVMVNILEYFGQGEVLTSGSRLQVVSGYMDSIQKRVETSVASYDINGLSVDSNHVLSFSSALQPLYESHLITNLEGLNGELNREFGHQRFFFWLLRFGLVFLFLVLVVNFMVFNSYFESVNDLQQLSAINQGSRERLVKLKEEVDKSEKMVNDILKGNVSKSSYYVDQIVNTLPESILLNELDFQPLLKRIKSEQPIEVKRNLIMVSGEVSNSKAFSNWISELEGRAWVKQVQTVFYGDRSKNLSGFTIKIMIRDEQ